MRPEEIEKLVAEFGPVHYYPYSLGAVLVEGWFLIKTSPTPPSGERSLVVADIIKDRIIRVNNGKVYHSPNCGSQEHSLSNRLIRVVEMIADQTFRIAVFPGHPSIYSGQPIAIALEPPISYNVYPDHPHLNLGRQLKGCYLPDSLCYTNNPEGLGTNRVERFLGAFDLICIWLFRHQIWLATRQSWGRGLWVGPQAPPFDKKLFATHLNPIKSCHCGSGSQYSKCHMRRDMEDYLRSNNLSVDPQKMINYQFQNWDLKKGTPQNQTIQLLRSFLK